VTIRRIPHACEGGQLNLAVDDAPGGGLRADLWPAVGEYPLYDPFLYYMMTNDAIRNEAFRTALDAVVAGRRVLDIGTGQDLNWALEAVSKGASHVVAVEAIPESYSAAARRLAAPEAAKIDLVHGLSFDIELPQRAEVCVAELIGSIASAEGMLAAMADAHARLLIPGAVVVPAACATMAGAMSLRALFPAGRAFSWSTSPIARASQPSTLRPLTISSRQRPSPMTRGSRHGLSPGTSDSLTAGRPNMQDGVLARTSAASASCRPPPSA